MTQIRSKQVGVVLIVKLYIFVIILRIFLVLTYKFSISISPLLRYR